MSARRVAPGAPGLVHVVGAGLAGLAAAVALAKAGARVCVHESAGHAGGRCRSFFDDRLGVEIDNGNHLLLGGNAAALGYLRDIGAEGTLLSGEAAIPFFDLAAGRLWTIRPNSGRLPLWIFARDRRVPGSRARDYLAALKLALVGEATTVEQVFGRAGPAYRGFWEPLAVAVLNTAAGEASARLLWPVVTEILSKGAAAAHPMVAGKGLSRSFVDGVHATFRDRIEFRFNDRLRALTRGERRVAKLAFSSGEIELAPGDRVVLAVPPTVAADLLPGLVAPDAFRPIVNLHFRIEPAPALPGGSFLLGLIGGTAQWLFRRDQVLSVTISAAEREIELEDDRLVGAVWRDIETALALTPAPAPPCRIVKERRATFAQTPAQLARRPGPAAAGLDNLALAGDWTDTGLPATIEGAIRSGGTAARLLLRAAAAA